MNNFDNNIKLVYLVLNRYYRELRGLREDLIQVGMIGLWKATSTFKPEKGICFTTYACACIRNEMSLLYKKEKNHLDYDVELVEDINSEVDKTNNYEDVFVACLFPHVFDMTVKGYTHEEIAKCLGLSRARIGQMVVTDRRRVKSYLRTGEIPKTRARNRALLDLAIAQKKKVKEVYDNGL